MYYHRLLSDPLEDEDAYRQLSPQQPRPSSKSSSPELSSRVFSPELGLPSSSVTYPTPPVLSSGSVSRDQSPSSSLSKLPGLSSQGTREELNGYLAALLDEGVYDDIDNDDYGKENSGEGTLEEEEVTVVQETVRDEETASSPPSPPPHPLPPPLAQFPNNELSTLISLPLILELDLALLRSHHAAIINHLSLLPNTILITIQLYQIVLPLHIE